LKVGFLTPVKHIASTLQRSVMFVEKVCIHSDDTAKATKNCGRSTGLINFGSRGTHSTAMYR